MEIISYVLEGALEHGDSMGNRSVIRPGEVQRMSAGTGVRHSEFNHSQQDPVHFLQIWIVPDRGGLTPSYEQKAFSEEDRRNGWRLLASADGREGSVTVHQDIALHGSIVEPGVTLGFSRASGRGLWLHVASGRVRVNGQELGAGDAVATDDEDRLDIEGVERAELLLFDLG